MVTPPVFLFIFRNQASRFRLLRQLFSKIRMCNRNQCLGPLFNGLVVQIGHAIFRHHIHHARTRRCHGLSRGQCETDRRAHGAVFLFIDRFQAQEALSTFGNRGCQHIIELPAGTRKLFVSDGFRSHLPVRSTIKQELIETKLSFAPATEGMLT